VVTINEKLYLFGGRDKAANELDQFFSFDLGTHQWTKINAPNPPPPRSYHTAAAVDDKLFIFGGCGLNNSRLCDVHAFSVTSQTWTSYAVAEDSQNLPKPRGGASVAAFAVPGTNEYEVFVYGGFTGYELGDAWIFNTGTREWREVQMSGQLPEKRSVFGYTVLGDVNKGKSGCQFVIYGGEGSPSSLGHLGAGNFFADAFALNLKDLVWKQVQVNEGKENPGPRGWLSMAPIGDKQVVIHGGLNEENSRLSGLYLLDLENIK